MRDNPPFDPQIAAKKLLREARSGALATLTVGTANPYCSLVNVASATDGTPLLLLSRLAIHTQNLLTDPRVSLMLQEPTAHDPLRAARLSVAGTAAPTQDADDCRRYLARHDGAEFYVDFKDFAMYRVTMKGAHLVAGFGRIADLTPEQMLTPLSGAEALVESEADICSHINSEHADAVRLYATRLLGAPDGAWRCVGCDPEGLELQCGRTALRLAFDERVASPAALRRVLKRLAESARATPG
ncbi:MAG TPA: DUF2470 domain-containing protein [Xanthobacteraceae bacterium]|nr:DUF2470 domain-containing protein [Xanthobacteraceae bacterium]